MKRRLIAFALLYLHVAQIAYADVLVVWWPPPTSPSVATQLAYAQQRDAVAAIMDTYSGPDHWQGVDPYGTKTLWCNTGAQVFGSTVRQFDLVMHVGFSLNNGGTVPFSGSPLRGDSLLRTAVWDGANSGSGYGTSVPQIFVGAPRADAFQWDQTSACSTGTTGYSSGYDGTRHHYSLYMVGKPFVWKPWASGPSGTFAPAATSTRAHGIWRPVVSYGATGITSAALRNCSALPCDNVTRSDNPDSVLLWARYRSRLDTAPRIFVQPGGASATFLVDVGLIKKALAMGDSITGGQVFEDNRLFPRRHGLWIRRAFSRNSYSGQGVMEGGGIVCSGGACDSNQLIAGIDSLATLNIPFTVGVDPDSVGTYPSEKLWWARAPKARYGLEMYAGSIAARGGNATSSQPFDPFGHLRARNMRPAGASSLPATCASTDSTTPCLLTAARTLMETHFPGRVDHAIFPSFSDYSPTAATVANISSYDDSVADAAETAGWGTILFEPSQPNGNAGRTYSSNTGMNTTAPSAPLGGNPNTRLVRTLSGRPFKFLGVRWEPAGTDTFSAAGHTVGAEWAHGDLRNNWYPDRSGIVGIGLSIFYHHDFLTRTPVLAFNAAQLSSTGPGNNPGRAAFWNAKWITNDWRSTDALMIPGKQLDVWDYVENLSAR